MDDDRQLMKYLSWLDDLDQDFMFRDTDNVLTIKMDQDDLTGQPTVDNTLPYDPNVASFDYSNRMMPYNVNETVFTGAMDTTQPNPTPESYNYSNYLPNGGFYADAALPQPHVPVKPPEQQFVDMNHTLHAENSYMNTSDPQLCTDMIANPTNVNISQDSNQYTIPNDVDIKNDFFHEEKHILNDEYSNSQLPMNPISLDVNASVNNAFSQISSHNELYSGNSLQEPINIDHTAVDEKQIVGTVQNLDEASKPAIIEPPTEIQDDVEVNTKTEPSTEIKEEFKQEEIDLDNVQEQTTTSGPVEPASNIVEDEKPIIQSNKVENDDSVSHPIANGVDKINIEDELSDIQMCIRHGCTNRAVNNPEWEQEFCSNECVIIHCKNVFTAWVKTNEIAA